MITRGACKRLLGTVMSIPGSGDRTFELIGGLEPSGNESTGAWLEVGVFPASEWDSYLWSP